MGFPVKSDDITTLCVAVMFNKGRNTSFGHSMIN